MSDKPDWAAELEQKTPAPDWAFVEASNMGLASMGVFKTAIVANALRKAEAAAELRGRAMGMREAAEYIGNLDIYRIHGEELLNRADKLEHTTEQGQG